MTFKAGDKVRCIDNKFVESRLTIGNIYIVEDIKKSSFSSIDFWVHLIGLDDGVWYYSRFELVKDEDIKSVTVTKFIANFDGSLHNTREEAISHDKDCKRNTDIVKLVEDMKYHSDAYVFVLAHYDTIKKIMEG